jgi:hypothetical protein
VRRREARQVSSVRGWAYGGRKNVDIKDRETGLLTRVRRRGRNLVPLARVALQRVYLRTSRRGSPLGDSLGDMRFFIDVVADQAGVGFIRALVVHLSRQLKLQLDNGLIPIT